MTSLAGSRTTDAAADHLHRLEPYFEERPTTLSPAAREHPHTLRIYTVYYSCPRNSADTHGTPTTKKPLPARLPHSQSIATSHDAKFKRYEVEEYARCVCVFIYITHFLSHPPWCADATLKHFRRLLRHPRRGIVTINPTTTAVMAYTDPPEAFGVRPAHYAHVTQEEVAFSDGVRTVHLCDCGRMDAVLELLQSAQCHTYAELKPHLQNVCFHVTVAQDPGSLPVHTPLYQTGAISRLSESTVSLHTSAANICYLLENPGHGKPTTVRCAVDACGKGRKRQKTSNQHFVELFCEEVALAGCHEAIGMVLATGEVDDGEEATVEEGEEEEGVEEASHHPKISLSTPYPVLMGEGGSGATTVYGRYGSWKVDTDAAADIDACVFKYSRATWLSLDLVVNFVDLFAVSNMSINSYHVALSSEYSRRGTTVCCVSTFTKALQAALKSLDIDIAASFTCPLCNALPWSERVVVFDGTAIGYVASSSTARGCRGHVQDPALQEISRNEYQYITGGKNATKVRAFLKRYATSQGMGSAEKHKLLDFSKETVGLHSFLSSLEDPRWPERLDMCRDLLSNIATIYPIRDLIPRVAWSTGALDRLLGGQSISVSDRKHFEVYVPSLAKALVCERVLPEAWHLLIGHLLYLAKRGEESHAGQAIEFATTLGETIDEEDLVCMPGFPRIRRSKWVRPGKKRKEAEECTKLTKSSGHFTAGMFTMLCPHGITLGFHAMDEYESVETAFRVLYERFPTPPGIVIYDNACNLSVFCQKREPLYFSGTRFFIDRTHWKGHVGCHAGYCMDAYPKSMPVMGGTATLGKVNSQVCEQTNSKLQFIKTSASFMNEENYMAYVTTFFALNNTRTLKKL